MPHDRLQIAVEIVQDLQDWIEDRDGLSEIPIASLTWSEHALTISIGDRMVFCSETDEGLSIDACKREWIEYVESLAPFTAQNPKRDAG